MKYAYQYFDTELSGNKLKVTNWYDFTNLNEYTLTLTLQCDGKNIDDKKLILDIPPHEDMEVDLPFDIPEKCRWGVYLNVSLTDKKGCEVGMKQHKLCSVAEKITVSAPKQNITEDDYRVYIDGENYKYVFNKHYGNIESISKNGKELLANRAQLSVWRAATDNDKRILDKWGHVNGEDGENMDRMSGKVYSCVPSDSTITVSGSLAGVSRMPLVYFTSQYTFHENGEIKVSLKAKTREGLEMFLPRLGFEFTSTTPNDSFTYFGMGERENYCDMCHHTKVGLYESSASNEYVAYVRPQEHGTHTMRK